MTVIRVTGARSVPVIKRVAPAADDPGGGGGIGTGGNAPGGPFLPATDVLVASRPPTLYAAWTVTAAQRTEGTTFRASIRLSEPVAVPSVVLLVADGSSTVDLAEVTFPSEVEFSFGQSEATIDVVLSNVAAAASSRTLVLQIDPDATTTSEFTVIQTAPGFGPDTLTLTILEDPGAGTPAWTLVPLPATTPEGAGEITCFVELDRPATDDVQVGITLGSTLNTATVSTGSGSGDVLNFETVVTIPTGEVTAEYPITFVDNNVNVPIDPVLEVVGTISGGTVSNAAPQSYTTTILDNDTGASATPRVSFTSGSFSRTPGSQVVVTARLRDAAGDPASFQTRTVIPIDRSVSENAQLTDFPVDWGSNEVGSITFPPNTSQTSFTVTIGTDVPAGESASFDIQSATGNVWILGTVTTTTVTAASAEPTILMVPAMTGGTRRMVQGQVAIDPPSASLPTLALDTGETVQVVGQKRNGDGEWISGYFYGLMPETESVPGTGSTVALRVAEATDAAPAEAGTFTPTFAPVVSFNVQAANEALPYECSTALATGDRAEGLTGAGVGLTGGIFLQAGPELVRERGYYMRPVKQGVTPAVGLTSGDALGLVEVAETRIAGEENVFLFEGRWLNGAWDKSASPTAENPMVDGEVYLDSIAASVPSGWEIRFGTASSLQTGDGTGSVELLENRAEDYLSTVCSSYTFRFAVVTAGDANARLRADDYLAEKNIATAVGPLGPTRVGISGEASEPIVDWARAELRSGSLDGWAAVKAIGESKGPGIASAWGSGAGRVSWLLAQGPDGDATGGGTLIDGSNNLLPWWHQWLEARYALHACAGRNNYSYRDVETGEAAWWWNVKEDNGGTPRMPFNGSLFERKGGKRHWHFNSEANTSDFDLYNASDAAARKLAPTSRPWNTAAVEDPDAGDITQGGPAGGLRRFWVAQNWTHLARARRGLDQTWEAMRSWMAYRVREELCAFASRVLSPIDSRTEQANGFDRDNFCVGAINPYMRSVPSYQRLGLYATSQFNFAAQGFNVRAWAWASYFLQGFYSVAEDTLRSRMMGGDTSATGGASLLGELWSFFDLVAMPAGTLMRARNDNANPNPYDHSSRNPPDAFERPDLNFKMGGLPVIDTRPGITAQPVTAPATEHFHQVFFQHSIVGWKKHVWGSFSPERGRLDRVLAYHDNYIQGQRLFGAGGRDLSMSYMLVASLGQVEGGGGNDASQIDRFTVDEVRAGAARWRVLPIGASEDNGWGNHFNKSGWTSLAAAEGLEDDSMLYIAKDVWGQQGTTDQEFVEHVMAEILEFVAGSSSGTEWTFMVPYIATLLNRYS